MCQECSQCFISVFQGILHTIRACGIMHRERGIEFFAHVCNFSSTGWPAFIFRRACGWVLKKNTASSFLLFLVNVQWLLSTAANCYIPFFQKIPYFIVVPQIEKIAKLTMKIAINAFETRFLTPFSFLQAPTQTSHFWTRFKKFMVASLSQNALSQKFRWKISGSYVAINRMYSDFPEKRSSNGLSMFLAITKFKKRLPGLQHIHLRSNFWTCGLWNVSRKDCCLPLNNRKRNTAYFWRVYVCSSP